MKDLIIQLLNLPSLNDMSTCDVEVIFKNPNNPDAATLAVAKSNPILQAYFDMGQSLNDYEKLIETAWRQSTQQHLDADALLSIAILFLPDDINQLKFIEKTINSFSEYIPGKTQYSLVNLCNALTIKIDMLGEKKINHAVSDGEKELLQTVINKYHILYAENCVFKKMRLLNETLRPISLEYKKFLINTFIEQLKIKNKSDYEKIFTNTNQDNEAILLKIRQEVDEKTSPLHNDKDLTLLIEKCSLIICMHYNVDTDAPTAMKIEAFAEMFAANVDTFKKKIVLAQSQGNLLTNSIYYVLVNPIADRIRHKTIEEKFLETATSLVNTVRQYQEQIPSAPTLNVTSP